MAERKSGRKIEKSFQLRVPDALRRVVKATSVAQDKYVGELYVKALSKLVRRVESGRKVVILATYARPDAKPLNVWLPADLHDAVVTAAESKGVSKAAFYYTALCAFFDFDPDNPTTSKEIPTNAQNSEAGN